ncbi:MAG TPA: hypothetical protein VJ654_17535 [Noviherbaspirillum sp.]|nr:hypothetical protein [Noviherbaspirillum sp.]
MRANLLRLARAGCLASLLVTAQGAHAGVAMDCEGTIRSWVLGGYYKSGDCHCSNGQPVCSGQSSAGSSGKGHGLSMQNAVKLQALQGVLDGIVNSMVSKPPPRQQIKPLPPIDHTSGDEQANREKQILQQQFDANKAGLLSDLKGIDSSPADGSAEALAAQARKPFDTADTAMEIKLPAPGASGAATPFFGDTMPLADIQLLVNPENDPRVVDLRKAKTYVAENMKADSKRLAAKVKRYEERSNGEPIIAPPACADLAKKLNGLLIQRNRFQQTVNMAQEQLETWQSANRNALVNAAKDGLEYFTGQMLEGLSKRGEAADRLQNIYLKHSEQMAREGLDVAGLQAKIRTLRKISAAGQVAEFTGAGSDWKGFAKDGGSSLLASMSASNQEIQQMLEEPGMQKYFETESPYLKTLLDISRIAASNKVYGKWVAKKIPVIGAIELGINQSYNALDWILSFNRTIEAHNINGKVLDAARNLQANINDTSRALKACP